MKLKWIINSISNNCIYIQYDPENKTSVDEMLNVTLKNLRYKCFALFSENIHFSMLKSDELDVRDEAIFFS